MMIYNVAEPDGEGDRDVELLVHKIFQEKFKLDARDCHIDSAIRIGKATTGRSKPRPILVRCAKEYDRHRIFQNAKNLRGTGIAVGADYPKEMQERRRTLTTKMQQIRSQGERNTFIRTQGTHFDLVSNGKVIMSTDRDRSNSPARDQQPPPSTTTTTTTKTQPSYNQGGVNHGGASNNGMTQGGASYDGTTYGGVSYSGVTHGGTSYGGVTHGGASCRGTTHHGASYGDTVNHNGPDHSSASHDGANHGRTNHDGVNHGSGYHGNVNRDGKNDDAANHGEANGDGANRDGANHGIVNHGGDTTDSNPKDSLRRP